MPRLYELASFYRQLQEVIEEQGGEITPEQESALLSYQDHINAKVDALRSMMVESRGWADIYKKEIQLLAGIKAHHERAEANFRRLILQGMEIAGVTEAGSRVPMKIYPNARPSFDWEIGVPIPPPFQKVRIELDREKAYESWKAGFTVEGLKVDHSRHVRERFRDVKGKGDTNADDTSSDDSY